VRYGEHGDRKSSARFSLEDPRAVCTFIDHRPVCAPAGAGSRRRDQPWTLTLGGYDPCAERLREALCVTGNGYIATRGAAPESSAGDAHYPGTYSAGLYNRLTDRIAGNTVTNESLVNLPNWLPLTFPHRRGTVVRHRHRRAAVLSSDPRSTPRHADARAAVPRPCRPHHLGYPTQIRGDGFAPRLCPWRRPWWPKTGRETLELRSAIDGNIRNSLVERYNPFSALLVRLLAPPRDRCVKLCRRCAGCRAGRGPALVAR
jgi:alpha,alpha-trehalase